MPQTIDKDLIRGGTVKAVFYFSGAAVFALLVAVILHELGHALAVYWTEGEIARISFNPFAGAVTSHSSSLSNPATGNARFISAGGVILGSILALLVSSLFLIRFLNPWTVPLAMIAVVSLAGNGTMLFLGVILHNVGDVSRLLELGMSKWFLLPFGFSLLGLGFFLFFYLSPYLGFGPGVPFRKRCAILLGGLLPYVFCVLGYNALHQVEKIALYVAYIAGGLTFSLVAVYAGGYMQDRLALAPASPTRPLEWKHSLYASGLAIALVTLLISRGALDSLP